MNHLFFLFFFSVLHLAAMQQPAGVFPVQDKAGNVSHSIVLPAELHEMILKQCMVGRPVCHLQEAVKDIRAWAHVNRNFYYTVNDERFTQELLKNLRISYYIPSPDRTAPSIDLGNATHLKTNGAGKWLADQFKLNNSYANYITSNVLSEISEDLSLTLFAIDHIPNLRLNQGFLNNALWSALCNEDREKEDRHPNVEIVIKRLLEVGAEAALVERYKALKAQESSCSCSGPCCHIGWCTLQ